jgi:CRP-like cAMP-binding protein
MGAIGPRHCVMLRRLLDTLDEPERRAVLSAARRRRFTRKEVVFHDGDPGDTLHLVVKGHFAVRITTPLGDVATVRVLGPGDHFGELAVLAPGPRTGTVIALDAGETLSLHRDDVARLRQTTGFERALTDALVDEVRRLASGVVDALYVPTEQRIWRRLRDLVAMYGPDVPVEIGITQDDLAQLAGTTRPTVNRVLQEAARQSVVRVARGRVVVLDLDAVDRRSR